VKTFIDSGVLITAWRGNPAQKIKALTVIADLNRQFISSPFVKLEVLPKPIWYQNKLEVQFYQDFFDTVSEWAEDCVKLADEALRIGSLYGLGGMDALHVAAAISSQADEFITTERITSPLSRVQGVQVKFIL
jgi:hypothetical protein